MVLCNCIAQVPSGTLHLFQHFALQVPNIRPLGSIWLQGNLRKRKMKKFSGKKKVHFFWLFFGNNFDKKGSLCSCSILHILEKLRILFSCVFIQKKKKNYFSQEIWKTDFHNDIFSLWTRWLERLIFQGKGDLQPFFLQPNQPWTGAHLNSENF